jgi:hypothetical protein
MVGDMRRVVAASLITSLVIVVVWSEATAQRLPVKIVNRTPLDTGDFSLAVEIDRGSIVLTGKFFPKTTTGQHIAGDVLLGVSFLDKAGAVLGESTATIFERDLGFDYEGVIGRAAPEPGGLDISAVASVVLTVRKLTTQEALDQEREKRQKAARAAEEARLQAEREAEAKQAREREAQRQDAIRARAWPKDIEAAVIERRVLLGMTTEQVTLAWGRPQRINQTLQYSGLSEQWVYSTSTLVYFENGRVTAIQGSR